MEKKFIELSLSETKAVVGGVKTAVSALNQVSTANVMVHPDTGMNGAMAKPSPPKR